MQGESPLNMMRPARHYPATAVPRRRRLWPILLPVGIVIALALVWSGLWYYAAVIADRTLSGWLEREAAAGRVYTCASQDFSGFPFRIEAHCIAAAAKINSTHPPFTVNAQDVTFAAPAYHPTLLVGRVTGPLALAELGQSTSFIADWARAQISVQGLPPDPDSVSIRLERLHIDHVDGANNATLFAVESASLNSDVIGGSSRNNPVIDTVLRFTAASAPTLHPLLAQPIQGEIEVVLRGFKDLAPKRWSERFHEMQAAGGSIEIKSLRIERSDATVIGAGTLTLDEEGKLNGQIRVAIAGVEQIVPLLGIDKVINQGINRLTGAGGQSPQQGPNALDRLIPGLSDIVRDTANASVIDNVKKMGQPTEIDKKSATVLPLRFSDGSVYLGLLPLGDVPPLF
jgi:hypothetical protein